MAELRKNNSQELIYLTKYHLFGRKKQVVTTHLDHPNISRIHVLFEWKDNNWVMQDKSRNGVWLNGKRINREYDYPIKAGDNIDLTSTADIGFTVVNIDPPKNALIAYSNNETSQSLPSVIFLDQLNLLPNESSPEVVLAYDPEHNAWTCENTEQMVAHPVEDGDKICFASTEWKLITGLDKDDVQTAALDKKESEDVKYVFRISQDE